ncbi:MAG: hypothetical protein ABIC18_02010 [Candidatus Omnitrophota bacterium]
MECLLRFVKSVSVVRFKEKGKCDDCGKDTSLWRLALAPNYDRRKACPKFFCFGCSKRRTDELRKRGIKVRGRRG